MDVSGAKASGTCEDLDLLLQFNPSLSGKGFLFPVLPIWGLRQSKSI
jgi:hypothetical protein